MNRESDEECLALIAEVRARVYAGIPTPTQVERLLDNLEARIEETRQQTLAAVAGWKENERLRGQLAELGAEFVKLTGEIERLHEQKADLVSENLAWRVERTSWVEEREGLKAEIARLDARAIAAQRGDILKPGAWASGMPAQDREAMEARNERGSAAADALAFTNPPHTAVGQCPQCGAYFGNADPPHRCKPIDDWSQPLGDPPRSQADLDAEAEEDRQRSEFKAHWREIIREEVAAEVARQVVSLRQVVAGAVEDMRTAFYARLEAKAP